MKGPENRQSVVKSEKEIRVGCVLLQKEKHKARGCGKQHEMWESLITGASIIGVPLYYE